MPKHREKLHDKSLYATCEEVCSKITNDDWVEVTELKSTQEEADTLVLLHALHDAKAGSKAVTVTAEDTALHWFLNKDIPCSIYQTCEKKNAHGSSTLGN